jgi:hypothetical protein
VLGAEERDELQTGSVTQEVNVAAALRVHTCVIGDQTDVLSTERREFLSFQNIQTGLHARRPAGML